MTSIPNPSNSSFPFKGTEDFRRIAYGSVCNTPKSIRKLPKVCKYYQSRDNNQGAVDEAACRGCVAMRLQSMDLQPFRGIPDSDFGQTSLAQLQDVHREVRAHSFGVELHPPCQSLKHVLGDKSSRAICTGMRRNMYRFHVCQNVLSEFPRIGRITGDGRGAEVVELADFPECPSE